ncbi:hypothetical protein OHB26_16285 [Nocardia sp. NBC_01503]|uniref:hypothetical protein n=1 Tax=Nocardia sp. NBC_01503 TaxID=2975997 RepID=UPI002E7B217B|nr:hypothetical protein [Nocardia sp. NBC_01503]WTL35609.1 hypothetical protein OHB26_16285 [Nocardia sp. NBC_01503]
MSTSPANAANSVQPPCLGLSGFVEPAYPLDWDRLPATAAAQRVCLTECPRERFRACAQDALRAGTLIDDENPSVANGVVMAGVVCRGDTITRRRLQLALGEEVKVRVRPDRCLGCRRPMTTRRRKQPGYVVHESDGRCGGCKRAEQRAA